MTTETDKEEEYDPLEVNDDSEDDMVWDAWNMGPVKFAEKHGVESLDVWEKENRENLQWQKAIELMEHMQTFLLMYGRTQKATLKELEDNATTKGLMLDTPVYQRQKEILTWIMMMDEKIEAFKKEAKTRI